MIGLLACLAGASLLIAAAAVPLVRRWALAGDFVDRPGPHKLHQRATPLGGGVAIHWAISLPIIGTLLFAWVMVKAGGPRSWVPDVVDLHLGGVLTVAPLALAMIGGAMALHAVGLIDDRYTLRPRVKLLVQFLVAAILVLGFNVKAVAFLPEPIGTVLSVLWIVLITNSFNLLDNTDGLSAGVAAIAALLFAISGYMAGQVFVPAVASLIFGAALGFLIYNFPPARIFMGDAGSLVLGYWLATISVLTTYYHPGRGGNPWVVMTPLVVLAVPLYDVASVILIRLRESRPIWVGDRRHFSHRLLARGLSARKAVVTIYLASAAAGVGSLMIHALRPWQTWLVCSQTALILLMIALLESGGNHGQDKT